MFNNLDTRQARIVNDAGSDVDNVIEQLKAIIIELDDALTDAKDKIADLESEHQK